MWTYIAAALAALAIGFASGWQTRSWKAGNDDAERLKAEARTALQRADRVDAAAVGDQGRVAAIRVQERVIYREVASLVAADPGLAAVCIPDAGLQLIAAATGAASSASQPAPAVRAASAAD